jgi:hypothetical protein
MLFILHSLDEPNKNWGKKTKNNEQIMNKNDNNVFEKVLEVDTWIGKRPWTKPAKTEANEKKQYEETWTWKL